MINPRVHGAKGDGVTDDTLALQRAINQGGMVDLEFDRWLTGPLYFPGPGCYLRGDGYMGVGQQDGPCGTLVARNQADDRPLLSLDASLANRQWLRNVGIDGVAFDISTARRFQAPNPPPVVSLLGVSNLKPIRNCIVYGNRGTAFNVGTNPKVDTAYAENVELENCGCYGNFLPDGTYGSALPAGPLFRAVGDRIKVKGGLWAYGCSTLPIPFTDTMADFPGFHFLSEVRQSDGGVNVGIGSGIYGAATTNMPVAIRISVLEHDGLIYGPTEFVIDDVVVEGFHHGLEIGQEPVSRIACWSRPNDIQVHRFRCGGSNGWYGLPTAHIVMADNFTGGEIHVSFLGKDGDVTLGKNSAEMKVYCGGNPNGYTYRVVDDGKKNQISYAGG